MVSSVFIFTPMGKWSNLTSICLKWVVEPPTRCLCVGLVECFCLLYWQVYKSRFPPWDTEFYRFELYFYVETEATPRCSMYVWNTFTHKFMINIGKYTINIERLEMWYYNVFGSKKWPKRSNLLPKQHPWAVFLASCDGWWWVVRPNCTDSKESQTAPRSCLVNEPSSLDWT